HRPPTGHLAEFGNGILKYPAAGEHDAGQVTPVPQTELEIALVDVEDPAHRIRPVDLRKMRRQDLTEVIAGFRERPLVFPGTCLSVKGRLFVQVVHQELRT